MVVGVVAALSILPAARALEAFENREFALRAGSQISDIIGEAQRLSINGPGNVRTLSIDLYSKSEVRFSQLTLGDRQGGPNMSSAIMELSNGAMLVCSAEHSSLWIRSSSGDSLVLTTPRFDLRLSCVMDGRSPCVVAEVV
jgi:hypothetical protein